MAIIIKGIKVKPELPKKVTLQATELERYSNCKLNFWHNEIFHKEGNFKERGGGGGMASSRGTYLHKSVERFLMEYQQSPFLKYSRLQTIWGQESQTSQIFGEDKNFIASGFGFLQSFHNYFVENQSYDIRTIELEKPIETTVKYRNLKIKLGGRIDHLNKSEGKIDINDWKFPKEADLKIGAAEKRRGYYQLAAYAHLSGIKNLGKLIIFQITPKEVIPKEWDYSEAVHIDVKKLYEEILDRAMDSHHCPKEWQPTKSSACSYCYTRRCKHCPLFDGELPSDLQINASNGVKLWHQFLGI